MDKTILLGFILISLLLIGASCETGGVTVDLEDLSKEDIDKIIVCDPPYIRHAVECCLDANNNNICDKDETEPQEPEEPEPVEEPDRVDVSVDDDPQKGSSNAKVTIIEFSDFQCPFCGRAQTTVKQILETYGNDVRLVFRDFPLGFHENAQKAAEAAECADDQGKFWEYHDLLFENQQALEIADLKDYAFDLDLSTRKFNDCLDSGKYEQEVKDDMDDGIAAGVRGTPAFFINGRSLVGAQPFKNFKKVIDEELMTVGRTSAAYWSTQDIAISAYGISATTGANLRMKNNKRSTVQIKNMVLGGKSIARSSTGRGLPLTLAPGGTGTVSDSRIICQTGQKFSYVVTIIYEDVATGLERTFVGDVGLKGMCAS